MRCHCPAYAATTAPLDVSPPSTTRNAITATPPGSRPSGHPSMRPDMRASRKDGGIVRGGCLRKESRQTAGTTRGRHHAGSRGSSELRRVRWRSSATMTPTPRLSWRHAGRLASRSPRKSRYWASATISSSVKTRAYRSQASCTMQGALAARVRRFSRGSWMARLLRVRQY